jgi:hypothetical protein
VTAGPRIKARSPREGPTKDGGRGRRRQDRVDRGDEVGGRRSHRGGGEGPTGQREKDQTATGGERLGYLGVGKKVVPEVVGEVGVGGRQQSDEVVFGRPHCSLCRVGFVNLRGHKLHRQPLQEKMLSAL